MCAFKAMQMQQFSRKKTVLLTVTFKSYGFFIFDKI